MYGFLLSVAFAMVIYMTFWWWYSLKHNDLSLVDVAYGMGFVVIAISSLVFNDNNPINLLVVILITIWGLRLSFYIAKRKANKPEDWRYAVMRKKWGSKTAINSFFKIFLFQGLIIILISASLIISTSVSDTTIDMAQIFGLGVWLFGFLFESTADRQLRQFLKTKKDSNQIMNKGLWKFSRHPNYFGEVVQWWGLWIIVVTLPLGWVAIISPILITILILFVSGIPLLEKKYKNNNNYQQYVKKTSIFIPLPPKKAK